MNGWMSTFNFQFVFVFLSSVLSGSDRQVWGYQGEPLAETLTVFFLGSSDTFCPVYISKRHLMLVFWVVFWNFQKFWLNFFFYSSFLDRMVAPKFSWNPVTASLLRLLDVITAAAAVKRRGAGGLQPVTCWINQILETDVHRTAPTSFLQSAACSSVCVSVCVWERDRADRQRVHREKLRTRKLSPQVFFLISTFTVFI